MDQWVEYILSPLLEGISPTESDVERFGGIALLSADTDRIKDYVFETAKLPEIRGASMILDELNRSRIPELFRRKGLPVGDNDSPSCIVYAGGGSLLALAPEELVDELAEEIENLYPRHTDAATITCVVKRIRPDELIAASDQSTYEDVMALREKLSKDEWKRIIDYYHDDNETGDELTREQFMRRKNFSEIVALQGILLRREKESKKNACFIDAIPYARRCDACQIRPASRFVREPEERYLCPVCLRKFDGTYDKHYKRENIESTSVGPEGRRERKSYWMEKFEEYLLQDAELAEHYFSDVDPNDVVPPIDLSEIASVSRGRAHGYVGLVVADGDNIGRQIECSTSLQTYKNKSDALTEGMPEVVYAALAEYLSVQKGVTRRFNREVNVHPFEILTIGGDDLLLVVPGDRALSIAMDLSRFFAQRFCGHSADGPPLFDNPSLSVGVVIADLHTPIYFMRGIAEELLNNAKKKTAHQKARAVSGETAECEGAIDFLVLKSQLTLASSLRNLRSIPPMLYADHFAKERLLLTGRPYRIRDFDDLIKSVRDLSGFPRSQLHQLDRALHHGRLSSTLFFLYQYARMRKPEKDNIMSLCARWNQNGSKGMDFSPWFPREPENGYEQYWSPLPDILEIIDFVRGV